MLDKKSIDLKEVQFQELEILKTLIRIFEEEGLRYFAVGGTALGAIRHQGFIPWDDDIDIAMLREDYDKFLKLKDKLPENLFILNYETNKLAPLHFTKVMNKNIYFAPLGLRTYDTPRNLFLDIFPWDNFINHKDLKKQLNQSHTRFKRLIYKKNGDIFKKYKFYLYKLLYGFKESTYFYNKIKEQSNIKNGEKSDTWGYPLYNDILDYDDIFPLREVDFEDIKICIPNNCEKYLTQKYGDYMKIPDEKDRVNHSTLTKLTKKRSR